MPFLKAAFGGLRRNACKVSPSDVGKYIDSESVMRNREGSATSVLEPGGMLAG